MDLVQIIIVIPVGCLISGLMSCLRPFWLGIIPIILFSALYLILSSDYFFLLSCLSVLIYGTCRLILALINKHKQNKAKAEMDKMKAMDL